MLRAGKLPVGGVGVLGQVVGADDQKIAAVGYKVLHGQAGGGDAQHHAELGIFVKGHAPLPQALAAVLHNAHGGVPVLHLGHHGEHHPQRPARGGAQQGADLGLELLGLAQAVADAAQTEFGGLRPLIGIGHGAVGAKVEGAHGHRAAVCRRQTGAIEEILLLLVQNAPGQHHVAAAQQPNALGTGLHGGVDILRAEAVGQQLKGFAVPRFIRQAVQLLHLRVLALELTDAGFCLLAGDGIRVKDAVAVGCVQNDGASVAVVQKILAHLHDARDVHCPGNDGGMALAAALCGDDAQDHAGGHAEQVGGHQPVGDKDHRMIQRQPHPGAVGQDIDHPAGGVQNIHAAQLHIGVILHVGKLVGVALPHLMHRRRSADARIDAKAHLVHHALVVQHHALEQKDGLLGGGGALRHGVQLILRRVHGVCQQPQLPLRVERAVAEGLHMMFQSAHLSQHQPRGSGYAFINLHLLSPPAKPMRSKCATPAPVRMYWAAKRPAPPARRCCCL